MSENKARGLRFVYGVLFALFTVALGVLMIMQIWSIYRSAESSPYTVESISAHYNEISLFIWIWFIALFINVLLAYLFPETEKRSKAYVDANATLKRLRARLPEDELAGLGTHRKFRLYVTLSATVLCLAFVAVGLWLLLTKGYTPWFDKEIFTQHNAAADRLVRFSPWLIGGFVVCFVALALVNSSVKKETVELKRSLVESAKRKKQEKQDQQQPHPTPVETTKKAHPKLKLAGLWSLRILLFGGSIFLLIVGIQNGGMADVFEKAKNICTQCIGLG